MVRSLCATYDSCKSPKDKSELILGAAVFAQATDAGTLGPMLETVVTLVGHPPEALLADATSANIVDTTICERSGVVLSAPFQENDYPQGQAEAPGEPA